jgi:hypothetical protein
MTEAEQKLTKQNRIDAFWRRLSMLGGVFFFVGFIIKNRIIRVETK